jgi:hypothetical protein
MILLYYFIFTESRAILFEFSERGTGTGINFWLNFFVYRAGPLLQPHPCVKFDGRCGYLDRALPRHRARLDEPQRTSKINRKPGKPWTRLTARTCEDAQVGPIRKSIAAAADSRSLMHMAAPLMTAVATLPRSVRFRRAEIFSQ